MMRIMVDLDFEQAKDYALKRLSEELPPELIYHSVRHTKEDVVPAADRFAKIAGIEEDERILVLTAAWYHDIGCIYQRENHEDIGVEICYQVLPDFGYSEEQIDKIAGMIMATKLPQSPNNLLEEIIADADMDSLGREDFFIVGAYLRDEHGEVNGIEYTEEEWWASQVAFLKSHSYFTEAAHKTRDDGKARNLQEAYRLLKEARNN